MTEDRMMEALREIRRHTNAVLDRRPSQALPVAEALRLIRKAVDRALAAPADAAPGEVKGRCQGCGEYVTMGETWRANDGTRGHTVAEYDREGNPEGAPCGPVDFPPRTEEDRT